jgi:hypothetical protein
MADDVRLSTPVERIAPSADGVVVRAGGAEVSGDACVVAVPAFAVDRIVFDPPLPGWKSRAFSAVRYGDAAKLFLTLAEPSPPSATLSVPGRFWTYTQLAPNGAPLPVACSFAGSTPPDDASAWAAAVRALRPDLAYDAAAEPVHSTWAGGAYSARSLSSPLDDSALRTPVGRLVFAGEHTAGEDHALMEGALRSGIRAAGEVLELS